MKRPLIIAFILCFTTGIAISQVSLRPQIGINFPSLTDEIAEGEFEGNAGFQFGIDAQLGGSFYFQPGLNFESTRLTLQDGQDRYDMNISRINIPVYVGIRLSSTDDRSLGLRAFAGPNFAIHVNEDLDEAFGSLTKDNVKDAQISGVVGAGLDLSILFLDVAYKFGLSKFFEEINSDSKINLFVVNAGVRLGF